MLSFFFSPEEAEHLWPWLIAVIAVLICIALWGIGQSVLLSRTQVRLRHRLADAEARALRTQINPHFLYNTLNAIAELGYSDPRTADRVVTELSLLLRKALDTSHRQEIAVRDEVAFLNSYLSIQSVLLGERLQVQMDISERVLPARLPGMILQPLVENAVTHGISAQGRADIVIGAQRDETALVLTVSDHGPGLPAAGITEGIGLGNTRARLNHLYGVAASLQLCNQSEGGLVVRLFLPYHESFAYDETQGSDC